MKKMLSRQSIRSYHDKALTEEEIEILTDVLNTSASSINGFQSSVIIVTDKKIKKEIFKLTGANETQNHIHENGALFIFVADFNRILLSTKMHKAKYEQNHINDLLVGLGDAFIQATRLENAAHEMGLGTCYIGGIRGNTNSIKEIKNLLNITGKAFAVVALTVGKIKNANSILKPKINRVYSEKYDLNKIEKEIKEYDSKIESFWKEIGLDYGNYSSTVSNFYSKKIDNEKWANDLAELWLNIEELK